MRDYTSISEAEYREAKSIVMAYEREAAHHAEEIERRRAVCFAHLRQKSLERHREQLLVAVELHRKSKEEGEVLERIESLMSNHTKPF